MNNSEQMNWVKTLLVEPRCTDQVSGSGFLFRKTPQTEAGGDGRKQWIYFFKQTKCCVISVCKHLYELNTTKVKNDAERLSEMKCDENQNQNPDH